jgi:hypothetical protein
MIKKFARTVKTNEQFRANAGNPAPHRFFSCLLYTAFCTRPLKRKQLSECLPLSGLYFLNQDRTYHLFYRFNH